MILIGYIGYETRIGFPELKSLPIYFSVKRNVPTEMNAIGVVNYQVGQLNIGGAMDLTSGKFTAPRNGTYFFAFSGRAKFFNSQSCYLSVTLTSSKSRKLGYAYFYGTSATGDVYSSASLEATAHLTAGEQVYLNIDSIYYATLHEEGGIGNNQFAGWLLQEDVPESI